MKITKTIEKKYKNDGCTCGCCGIVPINSYGQAELYGDEDYNYNYIYNHYDQIPLLNSYNEFSTNMSPYELCK